MINLSQILAGDIKNAKTGFNDEVLEPGTYVGKLLGFTEEDTYQYVTFLINGRKYNFFYNYFIYDTQDLDAHLINWITKLATIPVDDKTSLLEIANSAIGSSYRIEIYNYTSKSGKNAGKVQHAIRFSTAPIKEEVVIETEEINVDDLPF